jgi:hypothetical protein
MVLLEVLFVFGLTSLHAVFSEPQKWPFIAPLLPVTLPFVHPLPFWHLKIVKYVENDKVVEEQKVQ